MSKAIKVEFNDGTHIFVRKMKVSERQVCDAETDMNARCNLIVMYSYCDHNGKRIYDDTDKMIDDLDEDIWYAVVKESLAIQTGKKKVDSQEKI